MRSVNKESSSIHRMTLSLPVGHAAKLSRHQTADSELPILRPCSQSTFENAWKNEWKVDVLLRLGLRVGGCLNQKGLTSSSEYWRGKHRWRVQVLNSDCTSLSGVEENPESCILGIVCKIRWLGVSRENMSHLPSTDWRHTSRRAVIKLIAPANERQSQWAPPSLGGGGGDGGYRKSERIIHYGHVKASSPPKKRKKLLE